MYFQNKNFKLCSHKSPDTGYRRRETQRHPQERTSDFLRQESLQLHFLEFGELRTVQPSLLKTYFLEAFYGLELRVDYRRGEICRGNSS